MKLLSEKELSELLPAEEHGFPSPIPTQIVSSDEYFPAPQSQKQKEVEARLIDLGDQLSKKQGLSRRRFFQTASGMAASYLVMNQVYGDLFEVSRAEAATPEMAQERAAQLKDQFIMDMHTHYLRDDTRIMGFVAQREAVGKAGWNPGLAGKPQTIEDLKFANYFKEIFLDSDTKIAMISSAPSEVPEDWFLTNEMTVAARAKVNREAGSRRMMAHAIFTPGYSGWMEEIDRAIETLKPDAMKGYTIGDNTHKETSSHPWRLDDEKLIYPAFEKFQKAGLRNVCIHKGLFPPSMEAKFPNLRNFVDVSDVGKAAKDWPGLNFIIYHSGYRFAGGGTPEEGMAEWNATGRSSWVSDLAEIPAKYGVSNVYGDLGQIFAWTTIAQPRLGAAVMGTLIKGLGASNVVWGTDAVWTGAPQWQIEALRRLEIPEDMQKQFGFAPLGPADGVVKRAIFGENSARLYGVQRRAGLDRFDLLKAEYEERGADPSNLRYGYVRKPA